MLIKLQEDLKQAQLRKDEVKVSTLRLLLSEIHNAEIQKGDITEEDILALIGREIKKRNEASESFKAGGREELALKEKAESEILQGYLPAQLSNEELTAIVEQAITEVGAKGISDMGKVIALVMGKVKGKADGARVSSLVKTSLSV